MLVTVDLGNTAIKFGAFDGDRLVATERIEAGTGVVRGVVPFAHVSTADEVVVVSSSPSRVEDFLAQVDRPVRVLGEDVQRAVRSPYEEPTDLGVDRIAAVFGAAELAGAPVVVVDAGTATTVDALDLDRQLVPVMIGPGLQTAAEGLRARAPHLPWPSLGEGPVSVPARGTGEALRAGFVLGLAGLVERLVTVALDVLGGRAAVVLTGGFAPVLSPHLLLEHHLEPHAVLHGIRTLNAEFPA